MSSRKNKKWRYQKCSNKQLYGFLNSEGCFSDCSKEKAYLAVDYYQSFCKSFEDYKIPEKFAVDYIKKICSILSSDTFYIFFGYEKYLLTSEGLFHSIVKPLNTLNLEAFSQGESRLLSYRDVSQPNLDKKDWLYQNLDVADVINFFEKENKYRNTSNHKFDDETKRRAAEFYLRCCSHSERHKIESLIAIDNISHITIDSHPYKMRFYFKNGKGTVFYHFGYDPQISGFAVW